MKRALLMILGLGFANTAVAGICQIVTPKNGKPVALSQIATNQAGCVDVVMAAFAQSGKSVQAFYSSSSEIPVDMQKADVSSTIAVSRETQDLLGPETAREGCMGRAQYRGYLKATFSKAEGLNLQPTGATAQECFKSAAQNYVAATARGASLNETSFTFKIKDQVRVGIYMSTPLQDAAFIKEAFEREF